MTDNSSSSLYARAARGSLQLSGVRGSVVVVFFFSPKMMVEYVFFRDAFPCCSLAVFDRAFFVLGNRCAPSEIPHLFCVSTDGDIFFPLSLHSSPAYINSTPMIKFWARGSSTAWLSAYAVGIASAAAKLCNAVFSSMRLYPRNAKFNLIGEKLDVKYPMHYVPEVLMGLLTVSGIVVSMD